MADELLFVRVSGVQDVKAELRALPPKLRRRALMNALRAAGRVFRDEARRLTPRLQVPVFRRGVKVREPGTVRRALSVRTSKIVRRQGDLGVFVNVRPLKRGQRGANNPADPFYWRWLEFGKQGYAARGFLQQAAKKAGEALRRFEATLGPLVQKLNRKGAQP